jgi:hypothetical protein
MDTIRCNLMLSFVSHIEFIDCERTLIGLNPFVSKHRYSTIHVAFKSSEIVAFVLIIFQSFMMLAYNDDLDLFFTKYIILKILSREALDVCDTGTILRIFRIWVNLSFMQTILCS